MAAGSVIPQGYASPYYINLIFSDSLLVAAGTERSLSGVDVRIRGAPHRCIGMARRKPETRSVGWSPNYIRESTLGKHGKPIKNFLDSYRLCRRLSVALSCAMGGDSPGASR